MSITTVQPDETLENIWILLVWELARVLKDANAADLAPGAEALLTRWEEVSAGQRAVTRAEVLARAGVQARDDALDDTIVEVDSELLRITRARTSARYRRYFKKPRHEVVRLALESELVEVRTWPGSLTTEPEAALQALGARLEADIAGGDQAVLDRQQAEAARNDYRVREVLPFIEEVNAARRTRYGVLIQRAEAEGLPSTWAKRFFMPWSSTQRGASRKKKKKAPQPPATQPQPTQPA